MAAAAVVAQSHAVPMELDAVAPGIIAGRTTGQSFDADAVSRLVPMKRAGLPTEVAGLVGYLASDDAAYITGQVISISGGLN